MDAAVRRAVRQLGLPVPAAVAAATRVPADLLGLRCGRIAPGYAAELLVLDDDLAVRAVLAPGG
jgi:N-acetylglucosamine-6-phosphate deacetylase